MRGSTPSRSPRWAADKKYDKAPKLRARKPFSAKRDVSRHHRQCGEMRQTKTGAFREPVRLHDGSRMTMKAKVIDKGWTQPPGPAATIPQREKPKRIRRQWAHPKRHTLSTRAASRPVPAGILPAISILVRESFLSTRLVHAPNAHIENAAPIGIRLGFEGIHVTDLERTGRCQPVEESIFEP